MQREAESEVVATHPAVLLGERQPEKTEFAHPSNDLVGELVTLVETAYDGSNRLAGEFHDRAAQGLMLIVETEPDHAAMLPAAIWTGARL